MPRTDRGSRVIAAPPGHVWAALVDPGALMAWLPPGGMTGRFERFDARPGGSYRMVLTYSDASGAPGKATAKSDIIEARFVDIVAEDVPDGISSADHAAGLASSLTNLAAYVEQYPPLRPAVTGVPRSRCRTRLPQPDHQGTTIWFPAFLAYRFFR